NGVMTMRASESTPAPRDQATAVITEAKRQQWGDAVMWDAAADKPVAVNRDKYGRFFLEAGIRPALEGSWTVQLADGSSVECRTVLSATRQMLDASYTPEQVEKL